MAPVRNLRGIGNAKPIPVVHFIPPVFSPVYKIEVVTDTETLDVTELLVDGYYLDGVTNTIGDFEIKLLDPDNTNSNKIEEFDTVNIYIDYGKTATTLRFKGKIERKSNQDQIYLVVSGRSIAMITTGTNVTYSSGGYKARSTILTEIIEKYFSGTISTSGIETDSTQISVNYEEIPFWDVVEDICKSGGRDAYVNATLVFNYFLRGSRENSTEAVVENVNLIEAKDYAKDTEEVYSKFKLYGRQDGNVPIIASSTEDTTYTKGITKEYKMNNSSIVTEQQASDLVNAEKSDKQLPPQIGSIVSVMLPTILPGEKINIANPTNNIPPAAYQINSFKQIFKIDQSPQTELIIQKERVSMSTIVRSNIKYQNVSAENVNPNELDYSLIFDYNYNSGNRRFNDGTFTNAELDINSSTGIGVLKTDGSATGSWLSEEVQVDNPVSIIEIRVNATDAEGTKYFVSLDEGNTFVEIGSVAGDFTFENAGDTIILRVDIKSADTRIEKIGILYSTTSI